MSNPMDDDLEQECDDGIYIGEFSCPHCGHEYEADADDQWSTHDDGPETCQMCGKQFTLECTAIELFIETKPYEEKP